VLKLAATLVAGAALAAPARAATVHVVVVPPFDPQAYAERGAVGLFVPGSGERVSRSGAIASLVRGKVEPSVLGGTPGGKPLISLAHDPAEITIYLALPPPGEHANTKRYRIAIVGGGYRGILVSRSTRIRGLVSIADVAPTARDLEQGQTPVIRARGESDPAAQLAHLDQRLRHAHDVRLWATLVLVAAVLLGALLAVAFRSDYLGRAGLLAAPAVLAVSLALSAAEITRPSTVVLLLAALTVAAALIVAAGSRLLAWALVGLVVAYLVVFVAWPEVNSFAAIGARPDGGGRFYGAGNLVETVLLTVSLESAALLGRRAILPVLLLALVTVGWSKAGADGGGLVVFVGAFAVLTARMSGRRTTRRRIALGVFACAVLVAALVGLDAATGGSSHVTHAVREGPVSLAGELGHRVHISAASVTSGWHEAAVFWVSIAALVILGTRERFPAGDALLAGIALSLLINDSPSDVASAGALSYAILWAYERVREPTSAVAWADSVRLDAPSVSPRA
jgi:hypothetical protein